MHGINKVYLFIQVYQYLKQGENLLVLKSCLLFNESFFQVYMLMIHQGQLQGISYNVGKFSASKKFVLQNFQTNRFINKNFLFLQKSQKEQKNWEKILVIFFPQKKESEVVFLMKKFSTSTVIFFLFCFFNLNL